MEDPEEGQDAIAEERDWFAAGETTCVLRPFPSPEAAGNAAASRDGPPSHSAAMADPDRPRPAGAADPNRDRAANGHALPPEAFQPALSRLRTLEQRELPFRDFGRVFERGDRDADEPDSLLDREQGIEQRPR